MKLTKEEIRRVWLRDRRLERRRLLAAFGVTLAIFLFCLCFRYNAAYYEKPFVPAEYFQSLWLAIRLLLARLTGSPALAQLEAAIEQIGSVTYYGAIARLRITAVSLVAGAGLALAGAVFQTAYRNPMASPNILGATVGVNLGNALVVMLYSAAAYEHIFLRYRFCYGLTAVCIFLVLLLGRLAGGRWKSGATAEMIMAGAAVSQILNVFAMYIVYTLPDEDLLLYEELSLGMELQTDRTSMAIFFTVMGLSILPVFLLRCRLNLIGMDWWESQSMGVPSGALRAIGQLCGAAMVTCAMIHCGEVGMITLVVPYIVRRMVGADFRRICVYSILGGGSLLMLCNLAASFFLILGEPIPVTFFINLVLVPIFFLILYKVQGGDWRDI